MLDILTERDIILIMKPLKIGIIGVGHMGQYHLNIASSIPEIEIIGIADIDEEKLNSLSLKFGVDTFLDYKKLIKKCDGVCIATPTDTHYEIALTSLSAGKHVLLEKPMTLSLKEAEELINIAKKKKRILQVGHVERFNGAVQQLKNIILNPIYIISRRIGPFVERSANISVVLDLMIHDIDIILNLINDRIVDFDAFGAKVFSDKEDVAEAILLFQCGCIASITASRVSQKKARTLEIMQKDSFVMLDYTTQDIQIYRRASSAYLLTPEEIRYSQESFVEHLFVHKENPLKFEWMHFINCIRGIEQPFVSNEQDLETLRISLEIIKKIESKRNYTL